MPELPEVETVRRGLEAILADAKIVDAKLNRPNLRFPFPKDFIRHLIGQKITNLSRRAKYLLIHLSSQETIISHLGMSGSWRIEGEPADVQYYKKGKSPTHDHFEMVIKTPLGTIHRVIYNDPRRFGFMLLSKTASLYEHPALIKLGIEPTGNSLSGKYLRDAFANKKTSLKSALLDQSIVAGLGNIYVCEALWRSHLSPERIALTLSSNTVSAKQRANVLAENIRLVINDAINAGGSSLRDYVHTDGSLGYFQHCFSVYDRQDQPCPKCGQPIVRITQSGRSSFYCTSCQK